MQKYFDFDELNKSPIVRILNPIENFSRVTPLFWIFLFSFAMLVVGTYLLFLSIFAWIGGFVFVFFIAVGVALFNKM